MLGRDGEFYVLQFHVPESLEQWLLHAGRLPLPPYIQREPGVDDRERYQTVFAREVGGGGGTDRRPAFRRTAAGRAEGEGRGLRPCHCTSARAPSSRCAPMT